MKGRDKAGKRGERVVDFDEHDDEFSNHRPRVDYDEQREYEEWRKERGERGRKRRGHRGRENHRRDEDDF